MARKKDKESGAVALAILLMVAIALVTPFAITAWWIICEIRVAPYKRAKLYEILPSDEEKSELLELQHEVDRWSTEVTRIEDWALDSGVRRRTDGGFDGRNRAGQAANEKLEAALFARQEADRRYQVVIRVIAERLETCIAYISQAHGARLGIVTFSALFFVSWARWNNWIVASLACGLVSGILIWAKTVLARRILRNQFSAD